MSALSLATNAWLGVVRKESGPRGAVPRTADGRIELGAAVFSLPDPKEANTTSRAVEGGRICVFTGFLFNAEDLRRELGWDEERPCASQAEIVLAGYKHWGDGVLSKLEGVFGLAIWDQAKETLLCGRDPMGLHPFYYSLAGGELIFSWDSETIRLHPKVPRDLNRVVLAEHLNYRWLKQEETFFQAIRRLPGGYGLTFARGRIEVFPYWDPAPPGRPVNWVTREELEQFPALLRKSVERTMKYGPIGIFLSGGFDSISIAAWASEIAPNRNWATPKAFSLVFPEGKFSEEPVQKAVAQTLGFPQRFGYMTDYVAGRGLLGRLLDLAGTCPVPTTDVFKPPYLDLLRMAKSDGCDIVLTGEGGDEWLTVTPAYAADLIRTGNFIELTRLLKTILHCWNLPTLPAIRNVLWTNGLRMLLRDWGWRNMPKAALCRRRRLIPKAIPEWLAPDPALRRELVERFENSDREIREDTFYFMGMREFLAHPLLAMTFEERFYRDRLAGVPTLHPYWDLPLVDFLMRTPPELLNSGGRSKALVRKAMVKRFPGLGFENQKKLLATRYCQDIYRNQGPRIWEELGSARQLAELGLVDLDRFHGILPACLRSNSQTALHRVWHGAFVEAWVRIYQ
jgi:asparagine synthase (glutamine-hydrolysing)